MNHFFMRLSALLSNGGLERHPLIASIEPDLQVAVSRRICYSKRYNFCYFRVPKSANSTISKTLNAHMLKRERVADDPSGKKAKAAIRGLPSPKQFQKSFNFTFVRDPAARVVSAWLDKGHTPKFMAKYNLYAASDPSSPTGFLEFLQLLDNGLLKGNPHWAPQSSILPFKGKGYDFIGNVETIDADLKFVCENIFGRFNAITNKEHGRTSAAAKLTEYVGDCEKKLIRKLYEEDYDLFYAGKSLI